MTYDWLGEFGRRNAFILLALVLLLEAITKSVIAIGLPILGAAAATVFFPLIEEGGRWAIALGRSEEEARLRGLSIYTGAILLVELLHKSLYVQHLPQIVPLALRTETFILLAGPSTAVHLTNSVLALKFVRQDGRRSVIALAQAATLSIHISLNSFWPNVVWSALSPGLRRYFS